MSTEIPSSESLRQELRGLTLAQIEALADRSGVPFGTLYKIRNGHTPNPGIETVRKFYALLSPQTSQQAQPSEQGA